jgi:hypothetical protein
MMASATKPSPTQKATASAIRPAKAAATRIANAMASRRIAAMQPSGPFSSIRTCLPPGKSGIGSGNDSSGTSL